MSSLLWSAPMRETTSDSAKTVQRLLMESLSPPWRESVPISSSSISRVLAITSRNRPVPAAHLSFITKSITLPLWSTFMTLLS